MKRVFALLFCFAVSLFSLNLISLSAHALDTTGWYWPVPDSKQMSRGYSSGHSGLDIVSTRGVNETVIAARAGTVVGVYEGCTKWNGYGQDHSACNPVAHLTSGDKWGIRYYQSDGGTDVCNYGIGNGVVIDHHNGYYTEYAHMASVNVSVGQEVTAGLEIGTMGAYGNATGRHLHFSIKTASMSSGGYPSGSAENNNPQGDGYTITGSWNGTPNVWYSTYEPTGTLDLNGLLDGVTNGGIGNYGTCDVYINNSLVANDVADYVQNLPAGTTYRIDDIKAKDGFSYDGLASGSAALSGTIQSGATVDVRLKFNSCTLAVKGILDGTYSDNLGNYGTFDLYINGSLFKNDVNAYSGRLTKGATYEIKDIKAAAGHVYSGLIGSLQGTIKSGNTTVRLCFDTTGIISEDWITVDKLPGNINSTICDIEYKNTYQTTAQSSPGAGWSQVLGSGNTTYVNDGNVWETEFSQQTSATCELVGSYYYHYCGTGYGIEHFENAANGYTTLHVAGLTNGNFEVVATQKDSCHDILQYELKHTAAPWEGQAAMCNDGRSDWWYIKYQYQSKKAVTTYDWTKTTDWTTTADSTASSVQYRYRLKSSLTKLVLPANLTTIEDEAFAGTVMNAVIVPDGCTTIGSKAFANCSELLFVSVPKGTTIAADAFSGCGSVTVNER